ncbi:MAG: aminotransferase class I/II-fold pyridoxal phosphate-dependent enzyme [Acidobacteriota bacterium]
MKKRIYLSPPHMGDAEMELIREAFASNWIAPLGPHVDAFEKEVAQYLGVAHAAALSSGTAALHLALILAGVQSGDEVICSTLTFSASANPVLYERASPVFIDCNRETWNIAPSLLAEELKASAARNRLPRAVIVVDLYGQSADFDPISEACAEYGVPIIEDAAEALGADYRRRKAGSFGLMSVLSFNGNKIITTSGGGMLLSDDESLIRRARFLATQARDPAPHYQHSTAGYNYRMSNILAAIGRGQMKVLEDRVAKRRKNFELYQSALSDLPGIELMPEADYGRSNRWLTCITIDAKEFGATREEIRLRLEEENIESRPVWKPLHLQPVFSQCRVRGGSVAEDIFERGLCLPSGSSLTEGEIDIVTSMIRSLAKNA